jgi:hypothetical protein
VDDGATTVPDDELGPVSRILAVPLIPFVAAWEAAKALGRGVVAAGRWARGWLVGVGRAVGRLIGVAGRAVAWPFRAGYRVLVGLAATVWDGMVHAGRLVVARLAAVARYAAAPVRAADASSPPCCAGSSWRRGPPPGRW